MVGFMVVTTYSLLTTYIYSKTIYKDKKKVLFISEKIANMPGIISRIESLNIYEKIIVLNGSTDWQEVFMELKKIIVMHIFSPDIMSQKLYAKCKCKIVLTEEGYGTYILEHLDNFNYYSNIDEIWLNDKELYIGNKYKDKVKEVRLLELFNSGDKKEELKELNFIYLFDYSSCNIGNIIFFDQYLKHTKQICFKEKYIFSSLKGMFEYYKVNIKKHPLFPHSEKFGDYPYIVNSNTYVPWELVVFNKINDVSQNNKLILLAIESSCCINTKIIFGRYLDVRIIMSQLRTDIDGNVEFHRKFQKRYGEIDFIDNLEKLNSKLSLYLNIDEYKGLSKKNIYIDYLESIINNCSKVDILYKIEDMIKAYGKSKISSEERKIICNYLMIDKDIDILSYLKKEKVRYITSRLEVVGLGDRNKVIGIYGTGKNTIDLIKFYESNIGKINSKIIFIDSKKESNVEKFLGRNIINVKDVSENNIDSILISSYEYEKEMLEELDKYKYSKKIYTLYDGGEEYLFDL